MEAKHTPGPWFAKREGFSTVYIEARLRPGVLQEVAACGPTEAGQDQQEANAAFIVRACNANDQLVAALRSAESALASCYNVTDWPASGHSEQDQALADVRAALTAAGAA